MRIRPIVTLEVHCRHGKVRPGRRQQSVAADREPPFSQRRPLRHEPSPFGRVRAHRVALRGVCPHGNAVGDSDDESCCILSDRNDVTSGFPCPDRCCLERDGAAEVGVAAADLLLDGYHDFAYCDSGGWKWSTTSVAWGRAVHMAALNTLDMSIATYCTPARQSRSRAASQSTTVAVVRPSTCPSSPCPPDRSTKPTCQRSTAVRQVPVTSSRTHRGRPRRISSMPSTRTASGSAGRTAIACVVNAPDTTGQDRPLVARDCTIVRPPSTT